MAPASAWGQGTHTGPPKPAGPLLGVKGSDRRRHLDPGGGSSHHPGSGRPTGAPSREVSPPSLIQAPPCPSAGGHRALPGIPASQASEPLPRSPPFHPSRLRLHSGNGWRSTDPNASEGTFKGRPSSYTNLLVGLRRGESPRRRASARQPASRLGHRAAGRPEAPRRAPPSPRFLPMPGT